MDEEEIAKVAKTIGDGAFRLTQFIEAFNLLKTGAKNSMPVVISSDYSKALIWGMHALSTKNREQ